MQFKADPAWATVEVPSYRGVHHRLKAARGTATDHPCVRCGEQAHHWCYDHADPAEVHGVADTRGIVAPYSLDLSHYEPLCRSCHVTEDWKQRRIFTAARAS